MNHLALYDQTRRHFLQRCGIGLGQMALAGLLGGRAVRAEEEPAAALRPTAPREPHFPAKAKRVIFLFMAGAPSQLELFDYKPRLAEIEGKPLPAEIIKDQRYAFIQPDAAVMGPRFKFARHGESGAEISELLPHLAKVVDEIALVRGVHTDLFNHAPAQLFMNTGAGIPGRPAMGSWLSYGLGSEADDLPSFVVLESGDNLSGGAALWSAGFLPGVHQGVPFRGQGDPILHVSNPKGFDTQAQRETLDLVQRLNRRRLEWVGDPEIAVRIEAYETAFRMQARAPELMDFSQETEETLSLYGAKPGDGSAAFANNCLLARRLAERGVRFIQVYHAGWDHHSDLPSGIRKQCQLTDQASAALLLDLKRRGLLEDTLVVWGGEFGRTPMIEASGALKRNQGRDHHPQAFTMWLAGGGVPGGIQMGKTDDFGFHPVEDSVHVHDLQATILHQLGLDHRRLTFRHRGLDFRLTGVEEHSPVKQLIGA